MKRFNSIISTYLSKGGIRKECNSKLRLTRNSLLLAPSSFRLQQQQQQPTSLLHVRAPHLKHVKSLTRIDMMIRYISTEIRMITPSCQLSIPLNLGEIFNAYLIVYFTVYSLNQNECCYCAVIFDPFSFYFEPASWYKQLEKS